MIRSLATLVAGVLLHTGSATPAPAAHAAVHTLAPRFGHVTGSAQVGAVDALAVLRHTVGRAPQPGHTPAPNGDANCDGQVNAADALRILSHVVGRDVVGSCIGDGIAPRLFGFPLAGVVNRDLWFTNYMDLDSGSGILDYQCGPRTYDGHNGVDIVLRSFREMDAGVPIMAALTGTVIARNDGEFDRHTSWVPNPGPGNFVVLDHGDGYRTHYLHMKKHSVRVLLGEVVAAGAILGEVGSSGMSSAPHLHIEFRRNGLPFESFRGPCGGEFDFWYPRVPYQDQFHLIDSGLLINSPLSIPRIMEREPVATSVVPGQPMFLWVQLANARVGETSRWELYAPDGTFSGGFNHVHNTLYSMSYWWGGFTRNVPGTWRLDFLHNGVKLASHSYQVVPAAGAAALPGMAPVEAVGTGGGPVRTHGGN